MNDAGTVEAIHVAPESKADPEAVSTVEAVAGRGLRGDRYFAETGTFSDGARPKRALTFIEAEAVEAIAQEADIELEPGAHRRNVTTRNVALNHLVGERFTVGDAVCEGTMLCEPCEHLQSLTEDGVLDALVHRGGLCAKIVDGGTIETGDAVTIRD